MTGRASENPTLSTVLKVQRVLEDAGEPLSRYAIHKRLGASINYPVLEAVLRYFAAMRLVVDEGRGGRVMWVHAARGAAAKLFASSRRVA